MSTRSSRFTVKGVVFSALFAALTVIMSFIHFGRPVPFTLETMGVMLTGAMLGARYGFFSIFTLVALVALGVPLLHGQGGIPLLTGPTGGFIWMFPLSALLIGYFVSRIKGSSFLSGVGVFLVVELFGSLLLYVTGVPWLAHKASLTLEKAMAVGCYPFLPVDAAKALVVTFIVLYVRRVYKLDLT